MIRNQKTVKYSDHLFILMVIPFIAGVNYYLTYTNIRFNLFFVITFILDTLEGYCAWYAARAIIIYLDKKFPWGYQTAKRLMVQIPLVALVVVSILIILTELVNAIARDEPVHISFYKFDIFIFLIWSFLINSIYAGLYFYKIHTKDPPKEDFIVSKNGNVQKVVYLKDIQLFYVDNQITIGCGETGKQLLPDFTLEKLEKVLDANFFRANRQYIIAKRIVDKVAREKDGKLTVSLKHSTDLPETITISRLKATAFKQWISTGSV